MASSKQGHCAHKKAAILLYKMAAEATAKEGSRFSWVCCTHAWNCFALSLKRAGELSEEEIGVFPAPPPNLQIHLLHPLLCLCRHTRAPAVSGSCQLG
eukprot:3433894-Rhodomonas_salina.1